MVGGRGRSFWQASGPSVTAGDRGSFGASCDSSASCPGGLGLEAWVERGWEMRRGVRRVGLTCEVALFLGGWRSRRVVGHCGEVTWGLLWYESFQQLCNCVQGRATQQVQWVFEILLTADGRSATQIALCPFSCSNSDVRADTLNRTLQHYSAVAGH